MSDTESKSGGQPRRADRVLLGRITAAQGLRGEVRVTSFTAAPEDIGAYGPLTDGKGRAHVIEALRVIKGGVLALTLAGVRDRSAAEALKGAELFVAKDRLPPPDEEEWYYDDLIGLRAFGPDDRFVGEVAAVQNYGAGDLLELRLAEGGAALLPFSRACVPVVDIAAGRLTVVMPEDIDEPEA